jgi:hypothetical protein
MNARFGLPLALLALAGATGCGDETYSVICPNVPSNFTLRDVRLDGGTLLVTGSQELGRCAPTSDPDPVVRHAILQLAVELADFSTRTNIAAGVRFDDYPLPADARRFFRGELPASLLMNTDAWRLVLPLEGSPFSLEFETGRHPERRPPMRMTLLEGDEPRLAVGFDLLSIESL